MSDGGKLAIMFSNKEEQSNGEDENDKVHVSSANSTMNDIKIETEEDIFDHIKNGNDIPQSDLRRMMSETDKRSGNVKCNHLSYTVTSTQTKTSCGALIDRGANGGLAGSDVRIIAKTDREVDVDGIDNHQMVNLPIVTAGAVAKTTDGEVIIIMHKYACIPDGRTIHSSIQLEDFKNEVNEKPCKVTGIRQSIETVDGHKFPLRFKNGLAYMDIRPFTDEVWNTLPQLVLTSDKQWDPSVMDDEPNSNGNRMQFMEVKVNWCETNLQIIKDEVTINSTNITPATKDYKQLEKLFLNADEDIIKRTFLATTQYARSGWITGSIHKTYKTPFPAMNVSRRNEPVSTDQIYSDTPSFDGGYTVAQFYTGYNTKVCDIFGLKTEKDFITSLHDMIRKREEMNKLISDRAQVEISNKVKDVLRHFCIKDWQSEPHFQHQNAAERRYQDVKRNTNTVLNIKGAPGEAWFYVLIMYVSS